MKPSTIKKLLDTRDLDPDYRFYKSLMLTAKDMEEM